MQRMCNCCGVILKSIGGKLFCPNCGVIPENQTQNESEEPKEKARSYFG